MNWNKASALAEIVSSVAILATLAYLAIQTQQLSTQTRQNTAAIVSNARQQSLDAELQLIRMVLDHPKSNVLARSALGDSTTEAGLSNGERAVAIALFRIREHQWLQYRDGQLDTSTWESYMALLTEQLNGNVILRQIWDSTSSQGLDREFVAAVQEQLSE